MQELSDGYQTRCLELYLFAVVKELPEGLGKLHSDLCKLLKFGLGDSLSHTAGEKSQKLISEKQENAFETKQGYFGAS